MNTNYKILPPVVEVKIKRPDTKYQLGFSVQNGVVRTNVDLVHPCLDYTLMDYTLMDYL